MFRPAPTKLSLQRAAGSALGIPTQAVSDAVAAPGVAVAGTALGNLVAEASAIGPKEGESGGHGAGKQIADSTKSGALEENKTANGGSVKCVFCGEPASEGTSNKINYYHAQARANGGTNRLKNVNVTCEYCNKSKGTGRAPKNPKLQRTMPPHACTMVAGEAQCSRFRIRYLKRRTLDKRSSARNLTTAALQAAWGCALRFGARSRSTTI